MDKDQNLNNNSDFDTTGFGNMEFENTGSDLNGFETGSFETGSYSTDSFDTGRFTTGRFEQPSFEENQPNEAPEIQPVPRRRRRKRSKWQIFKEVYLPVVILVAAVVLIIAFIVSAVKRSGSGSKLNPNETSTPVLSQEEILQNEQNTLLEQAEALAVQYDYQAAMNVLNTYTGGINTSETLMAKYKEYEEAFSKLVPYSDISKIPNLGVRLLIADLPRALADKDYGDSFNKNYITTTEFSNILQQLYDNGYMLVRLTDIAPKAVDADGKASISQGTIYLPEGKKPLVLTQIGVNYFTYIVDGDGDGKPDKDGSGFPYRLVIGADGNLTSEMVDAEGNVQTGSFDLVTILNDFIAAHPDFSYRGARATLAVTGYDGLFGYRTDPETVKKIGQDFYDEQMRDVVPVIEKLRADGYEIACMSYDYKNYALLNDAEIKGDMEYWTNEVKPLLGDVDIMVFPYDDIADRNLYTGSKFEFLSSYGFRYFVARDSMTRSWGQTTDTYARMMFREAGGLNMHKFPDWYKDLFDSQAALEPGRKFE